VLNSGEDGLVLIGKILEIHFAFGFDAQTGEYGNMLTKGIIDPTKVVRYKVRPLSQVFSSPLKR
jgi:chaperonin GroEL